jgi:O-antigen ligase
MAALGWVVVIQRELAKYGILTSAYQFSGEGNDKNYIALVLGASAITLYTLALLWKPKTEGRQLTIALARLVLITLSLILLYHIFLTYSRSGAITAILAYILTTWLIYSRKHGFARMLVILVPIALLFYFLVVPRLLKQAPTWESYQDISRLGARPALIQKGLAIVRDNPFIGIGIGNSNNHYQSGLQYYPRGLPHNMYLTNWAELGLLSLVGFIYIFYALLKMFRDHYYQFPIPDKIWLLLFVPVSIMAFTLDIGGIFNLMTVILAGMYQQQYISSPPKTARAAFPTQLQDVNVP